MGKLKQVKLPYTTNLDEDRVLSADNLQREVIEEKENSNIKTFTKNVTPDFRYEPIEPLPVPKKVLVGKKKKKNGADDLSNAFNELFKYKNNLYK